MPTMNIPEVNAYIGAIRASGDQVVQAAAFIAGDTMGLDGLTSADSQVEATLKSAGTSVIDRYHRLGVEMNTQGDRLHTAAESLSTYKTRIIDVTNAGAQQLIQFDDQQSSSAAEGNPMFADPPVTGAPA